MLDLEKAQRMSLTMQVEASLKSALIVGALRPGARLITKEIAEQLGTSITPVREALLRLVSSGALNATPAQAFLVPEMTLERYQEITQLRKQLEGMAVSAASSQMTPEKVDELRKLADAFNDAIMTGNVEQALLTNRNFRFKIYEYAEMPTLINLIEQLWVRIGPCCSYLYPENGNIPTEHPGYDDLIEALARGDELASLQEVCKAIDAGASVLQKQYFS